MRGISKLSQSQSKYNLLYIEVKHIKSTLQIREMRERKLVQVKGKFQSIIVLKRYLLLTNTQHPIELNPEFVNVQKIRQLEFYYYKIKCFGEQCPISFQMIQSDQTKFKMFLSSTNPFPSKFSCEQIYQVKVWKYKGNHHKLFK